MDKLRKKQKREAMKYFHFNALVEEYLGTHYDPEAVFTDHMELGDAYGQAGAILESLTPFFPELESVRERLLNIESDLVCEPGIWIEINLGTDVVKGQGKEGDELDDDEDDDELAYYCPYKAFSELGDAMWSIINEAGAYAEFYDDLLHRNRPTKRSTFFLDLSHPETLIHFSASELSPYIDDEERELFTQRLGINWVLWFPYNAALAVARELQVALDKGATFIGIDNINYNVFAGDFQTEEEATEALVEAFKAKYSAEISLCDAEYDAEDEPDFWDLVSEQDFANPDLEDFNDLAIVVKLNNIQVRNFVKRFPQVSRLDTPPEMMKDSND